MLTWRAARTACTQLTCRPRSTARWVRGPPPTLLPYLEREGKPCDGLAHPLGLAATLY